MLKTTYQIFDSSAGKTIVFKNLYFLDGAFVFNGEAPISDISTYPNVHYRHTNFKIWAPKIINLNNELSDIQTLTIPHFYLAGSLDGHPGHTLMDDIFSIFYALHRCQIDYNNIACIYEPSRGITINDVKVGNFFDCNGMFNFLFGHETISFPYFKKAYPKVCFETFIVGTGNLGFSCYDINYVSPFQDDIWKKFRNAFYDRAQINLEPEKKEKIIYVNIRNPDESYLGSNLINFFKENDIEIINWWKYLNIKDQLELLKNVKVYITMDGSCALNSVFLQDDAVTINLGRVYANEDYRVIGYVEDYLYPALSYIDVIYFEDYYHSSIINGWDTIPNVIPNVNDLINLINDIIDNKMDDNSLFVKRKNIYENFATKVMNKIPCAIKLNNYSPNARLFLEHYINSTERANIIEKFKRGNIAFACNEEVRQIKLRLNQ